MHKLNLYVFKASRLSKIDYLKKAKAENKKFENYILDLQNTITKEINNKVKILDHKYKPLSNVFIKLKVSIEKYKINRKKAL